MKSYRFFRRMMRDYHTRSRPIIVDTVDDSECRAQDTNRHWSMTTTTQCRVCKSTVVLLYGNTPTMPRTCLYVDNPDS